jgi:RimJ/RimL family protein N-acetyltransferase
MTAGEVILSTPRLLLRSWREADRDAFAALNAGPEIMWDLGGPARRFMISKGIETDSR